jgi:hypothetical protein
MGTLYLWDETGDYILTEAGERIILEDGNVDTIGAEIRMAQDHVQIVDSSDPLAQTIKSTSGKEVSVSDTPDTGQPVERNVGKRVPTITRAMEV